MQGGPGGANRRGRRREFPARGARGTHDFPPAQAKEPRPRTCHFHRERGRQKPPAGGRRTLRRGPPHAVAGLGSASGRPCAGPWGGRRPRRPRGRSTRPRRRHLRLPHCLGRAEGPSTGLPGSPDVSAQRRQRERAVTRQGTEYFLCTISRSPGPAAWEPASHT